MWKEGKCINLYSVAIGNTDVKFQATSGKLFSYQSIGWRMQHWRATFENLHRDSFSQQLIGTVPFPPLVSTCWTAYSYGSLIWGWIRNNNPLKNQVNNSEWLSSLLLILLSLWLLQCHRCWRVPEEIWALITTKQSLRVTWVGTRTKYKPRSVGCFKSTAGNWTIWSKRRQCLICAEWTGQRAFWCGSNLCKLIHSAVMKKNLMHLIPFFLLAPRPYSHHPSSSLAGPTNRYLFCSKWNRRHWNNSFSVLPSRPWCSGYSFGTHQLKSILWLTPGKDMNLFFEIYAPIIKWYKNGYNSERKKICLQIWAFSFQQ